MHCQQHVRRLVEGIITQNHTTPGAALYLLEVCDAGHRVTGPLTADDCDRIAPAARAKARALLESRLEHNTVMVLAAGEKPTVWRDVAIRDLRRHLNNLP